MLYTSNILTKTNNSIFSKDFTLPSGLIRELNFLIAPVTSDCEIAGDFSLQNGAAKLTGPLILSFHKPVVLLSVILKSATGPNYISANSAVKHFVAGRVDGPMACSKLSIHLHVDSELESIKWQKLHSSSTLPTLIEGEELHNTPGITWQDARITNGKIPAGAVAWFNPPAVVFSTDGEVKLFSTFSTSSSSSSSSFSSKETEVFRGYPGYPDPVSRVEFLEPCRNMVFYQCLWKHSTTQRRCDFTCKESEFSKTASFVSTGKTTETGFSGTILFAELTRITRLHFSAPTICVLDTKTYKVCGSYELDIWVNSLVCTNLLSMDYSYRFTPTQSLGAPTKCILNFTPGEICLQNKVFTCEGMAAAEGIVARGNSKTPEPSLGTIKFTFFQPTYLHHVEVVNYTILQCKVNDKLSGTKFNDWITQNYALATNLSIYTDGVVKSISYLATPIEQKSRFLYTEDFQAPVDFACVVFDTAASQEFGTPNAAFGGPGQGLGGSPGPGENSSYLGWATTEALQFNTWVAFVDVIGLGHLVVDNEIWEIPKYGANAYHRVILNKRISTLNPVGVAITSACYKTKPRFSTQPENLPPGIYKILSPNKGLLVKTTTMVIIPEMSIKEGIFESL